MSSSEQEQGYLLLKCKSWAMNVTSIGNVSRPHVLNYSNLKIRIAMHVTCIQKAIGLNTSRVWPFRMCCSVPWLTTPLKCSNTSAGSLPYIRYFENNRTNLMIFNSEKNTYKKTCLNFYLITR